MSDEQSGPDLDLLRTVRQIRADKGGCTLRDLATALDLSIGGVQYRVDRALEAGHLEKSDTAGSLRPRGELLSKAVPVRLGVGVNVDLVVIDGEVMDVRLAG